VALPFREENTMGYGTTNLAEAQLRYLAEAVETATPAARLGMLWDRLQFDLHQADDAFGAGDLFTINEHLVNAQQIVMALADTLRTDTWAAAPRLASLYGFLHQELLQTNMTKDRERLASVVGMVGQLADAWRAAIVSASRTDVMVHGVA